MISAPDHVKDREWLAETLTRVAGKALGFGDAAQGDDLETLRAWILEHRDPVLDTAFAIFVRTAEDLEGSAAAGDLTAERAAAAALVYLAPPPE